MKKFLVIVGVMVLMAIMSGCGSANNNNDPAPAPAPVANPWSFAVSGGDGAAENNGDGSYLVTHYDVDNEPSVIVGDLENDLGVIDMVSLMDAWPQVAQESNSTGVIHYTLEDGSTKSVAVRIDNPTYNVDTGDFQYTATPLFEGDTLDSNFTNSSLQISKWDWTKLGIYCGKAIVEIIIAAVQDGADPLSDVEAAGGSAECIAEVIHIWGK
jgi:hypothetical protein